MNVITGTLITLGGVFLVNKEFKKQQARIAKTSSGKEPELISSDVTKTKRVA